MDLGFPLSARRRFVVLSSSAHGTAAPRTLGTKVRAAQDRKSTRLNSSHLGISYAVFCLKKKTKLPVSRMALHRLRRLNSPGLVSHPTASGTETSPPTRRPPASGRRRAPPRRRRQPRDLP